MESPVFNSLSELNKLHRSWNIRVKVLRCWFLELDVHRCALQMILVDEPGQRIPFTVLSDEFKRFSYLLSVEGCWVDISGFTVDDTFPGSNTNHRYHLYSYSGTSFRPIQQINTHHSLVFQTLNADEIRRLREDMPIDGMLCIYDVGPYQNTPIGHRDDDVSRWYGRRIRYCCKDEYGNIVHGMAYGQHAEALRDKWITHGGESIFCVGRFLFPATTARGFSYLSMRPGISDISFNPTNVPEIYRFILRMPFPWN